MTTRPQRDLFLKILPLAVFLLGLFPLRADLTTDLLMYWPMEQLVKGKIPDRAGTNDLVAHNISEGNFVPGKFGRALSFNGLDQLLSLERHQSRALPIYARQDFTIAMWVRGAPRQSNRILIGEGTRSDIYPLFLLGTHRDGKSGQLNVFVRDSGVVLNNIPTEGTVFNDEWTHIAWVNLGDSAKVYINGVMNTEYRYERPQLRLDYLSIGALFRDPPVYFFQGEIDEVAVWERLLTAKEIKQVMTNGLSPQVVSSTGK